jgi:hypothetical protein
VAGSTQSDGFPADRDERAGGDAPRVLGLAGSVTLHGLLLAVLFVAGQGGWQASAGGARLIPVEVVAAAPSAPLPPLPAASVPSANTLRGSVSDLAAGSAVPAGAPEAGKAKIDALDAKLAALAELHQSDAEIQSGANREMAATGETRSFGLSAPFGLRDFLRAQVERRWHLDLAGLGGTDILVPIHVEITRDGRVLKAEIADGTQRVDPVYREIAASARNAVLAASPFALPPGRYDDVMEVRLELDPRATLH